MTKAVIVEMCSDWAECDTMEYWEQHFGIERLVKIMKGMDSFYAGHLVSGDTPLGYVSEDDSLDSDMEFSSDEANYVFSEYAEQECSVVDRY